MLKMETASAEEGMVLAKRIVNKAGITLAGEGTRLNERMIERFLGSGIDLIWVEGEEPIDPDEIAASKEAIERRFSLVADDPLLIRLKQVLLESLPEESLPALSLSKGSNPEGRMESDDDAG